LNMLPALVSQGLDFLKTPPFATYAILGIAIGLGFVTSFVNARMTDLKAYRRMMLDSAKAQHQMMEAAKSGNQRAIDKAQKKQQDVMGQQSKMSMDRLKISLFFMIPFLLIWQLLGSFFVSPTGAPIIIAKFPFQFPFIPMDLSVANWYLLCSFASSIIISRVLGLTFEIDPEERNVKDE
jgi:uncharacterized membrane protein (DUF106 family)